jgi:hypothetical protein
MGWFEEDLQALDADYHGVHSWPATREEWQSGYHDGYADGRIGRGYGSPATNSDPAAAGYAFGYSDGELARQDRERPGWIW